MKTLHLAGLLSVLSAIDAVAAPVTWGVPFELVSDTDIDLSFGPVVYAQNGGDNIGNERFIPTEVVPTLADPKVVNIGGVSIPFEGIDAVYGLDSSFGQLGSVFETFGEAVSNRVGQNFNVTFAVRNARTVSIPQVVFDPAPATLFSPAEPADYSVSTGNPGLDSILDSVVFMDSRFSLGAGQTEATAGALEIHLNNLTAGKTYQVQVIGGADDRRFAADPMIIDPNYMANTTGNGVSPIGTLSDGLGNSVANIGAFLDLNGDGAGHVTSVLGTFTADDASQRIDLLLQRGRNAGISAVILLEQGELLAGDYNRDGAVNAADYTVWRDGGSPDSTRAGYDLWADNYGRTVAVEAGPSVTVPEPTAVVLLVAAGLCGVARRPVV